jgi:hypothetical protein
MNGLLVGNTQYTDAFQRANFWSVVQKKSNYHTLVGVATLPPVSVTVPSANDGSQSGAVFHLNGQCGTNTGNTNTPGNLGVMDINFWDAKAQALIKSLGLNQSVFPLFLFYNAVMSDGNPATNLSNCCILGYHNAVGSPVQTYGVGEFEGRNQTLFTDVADITALSHEIAEWMDDPLTNNLTPLWGHIGQVPDCQNNLEVGDPLSRTLFPVVHMPNGFNYHPQEMAFFSWFFRQNPSLGAGGKFSNNGQFTTDAGTVCNP